MDLNQRSYKHDLIITRSVSMDPKQRFINEGTTFQRNYGQVTILWSFSYNSYSYNSVVKNLGAT